MSKRAAIKKLIEDVRASYWFLPTVLALSAVVLAQATQWLDHHIDVLPFDLPESWTATQVDGARATVSVIAQSMIGVAGVMFSMTMVAVSFASGNFGPRLIGNFMRDRGNQWSLGVLVATFVFALLILRAIQSPFEDGGAAFVPHLSLAVAYALTGLSISAMIFFVHHVPETINVSNISANLGKQLCRDLERLIDDDRDATRQDDYTLPLRPADAQICLDGSGYIQTWDKAHLVSLADKHGLIIRLERGAGDFITSAAPVVSVWSMDVLPDALIDDLRDGFAVGATPTEAQNLLFIVEKLVEMIARALSPGINDPYTAINCLNWLSVGLSTAANYHGGLAMRPQGRVHHTPIDLATLLARAVEDPWPYIVADDLTCNHLFAMLERLRAEARRAGDRQIIDDTLSRLRADQSA